MVQNLIRTVCKSCGGSGCESCFGVGYAGRTIVSEVQSFSTDEEFNRMVAGEVFWPRIIEDAVDMLDKGITNAAELNRVYGPTFIDEYEKRHGRKPDLG
jgi:general secretion pathway protein E